MWKIKSQSLKKGSSTTVQSYQPTPEERELMKLSADYAKYVMPNAQKLNDSAAKMFFDSLGDTKVDYKTLLQQAQQQTSQAQQGVANLTQGVLPAEYQKNMENSIRSGVENTMGNVLNSFGNRGILNSSVTNTAMNDISKNAADTMAQQYQNNISTLNGLYGQQAALAGQNITTSAAAQEAAQAPAVNAWNMSLGLGGATNGALQAVAGRGTTTSTQKGGGGGLFGGILTGLAGNPGLFGSCFTDDTKVRTPEGEKQICNIEIGDKVISDDGSEQEVIETMEPQDSVIYTVIAEDNNKENYVNTTLTQPLMTSDGDFVDVGMLRIGMELEGAGRVLGVVESGERKVYDLKVTGPNTYFANGFVAKGATDEW